MPLRCRSGWRSTTGGRRWAGGGCGRRRRRGGKRGVGRTSSQAERPDSRPTARAAGGQGPAIPAAGQGLRLAHGRVQPLCGPHPRVAPAGPGRRSPKGPPLRATAGGSTAGGCGRARGAAPARTASAGRGSWPAVDRPRGTGPAAGRAAMSSSGRGGLRTCCTATARAVSPTKGGLPLSR